MFFYLMLEIMNNISKKKTATKSSIAIEKYNSFRFKLIQIDLIYASIKIDISFHIIIHLS